MPIGYELFEGNKAEVKTLYACLESWKSSFNIDSVCFVADRALMSEDNLKMLEEPSSKYTYVIAAKLRSMPKVLRNEILSSKNYTIKSFGNDYGWVGEFKYKNRRLIVSYKIGRANMDEKKREKILLKIKTKLSATNNTKEFVTNNGIKKYTESENSKTKLSQTKIELDAMWDGLHGVITNINEQPAVSLLKQ
jgi:transposase